MSAERVSARVTRGGHSIPIDHIKRRYPKSISNLSAHIKACELAYILDNSNNYDLVATYRDGIIHRKYTSPSWFKV